MKSDKSIRNICIAAIKRATIAPYDFSLTSFFEEELWDRFDNDVVNLRNVAEGELPVSMVVIDADNYTLITTRQIITCQNGSIALAKPNDIISWQWNDFKGYIDRSYTCGRLTLTDNQIFEVFIETGRASMAMIYAIRTLVGQYHKSKSYQN